MSLFLAGSCGSDVGWLFYKNHCYLVVDGAGNQAKTWREARRFCQSKGGDLVSIGSVLEQFFVQHQVSEREGTFYNYYRIYLSKESDELERTTYY